MKGTILVDPSNVLLDRPPCELYVFLRDVGVGCMAHQRENEMQTEALGVTPP